MKVRKIVHQRKKNFIMLSGYCMMNSIYLNYFILNIHSNWSFTGFYF